MPDPVQTLYETRAYPAMSHPLADPAVSSVAALLGGHQPRLPDGSAILEIGCASGHHLIPLAMRWPEARLVGIDLSVAAIRQARELAAAAGVTNVEFHEGDLRDFKNAAEPFDFIIAHGFFSWVADDVKRSLLDYCAGNLSAEGIATISFNAESGWRERFPVIEKVRAILRAGAADEMAALAILRSVTAAESPDMAVIDDMMAKGPEILAFDDFAPVNDPWPLERFVRVAAGAGLRWLGDSDPSANDGVARTFHSAVLCHAGAPRAERVSWGVLRRIFLRLAAGEPGADPVLEAISWAAPGCASLEDLQALLPDMEPRELGARVLDGIRRGLILPRIESPNHDPEPPAWPRLDRFRLECARRRLPLVDAWHRPCAFPERHYEVLAQMDGTNDQQTLASIAARNCPELDFRPWLRHLAGRGMFA